MMKNEDVHLETPIILGMLDALRHTSPEEAVHHIGKVRGLSATTRELLHKVATER